MPPKAFDELPFSEAIEYLKNRMHVPTRQWDDLWRDMHARGFMVAGAMRSDMLADFHSACLRAITDGTTIDEFRRTFDDVVARTGWRYHGTRGWRSSLIFNTNLTVSYAAGRWKQQTDPDVLGDRPYLMYKHGDSVNPRPAHLAWDGLVLPADDPWWATHYPPNGWGCSCYVVSLSNRDLAGMGKAGPDDAPAMRPAQVKGHTVADAGIDPGWDYNPGRGSFGEKLEADAMERWRQQGTKAYEQLTPGNWESEGRPELVPIDEPRARLGERLGDTSQIIEKVKNILGGEVRVFDIEDRNFPEFSFPVTIYAESMGAHLPLDRSPFLPFIPEALDDAYEGWLCFERHRGTGKMELRARFIKAIALEKGRSLLMVAQANKGTLEGWTFFSPGNPRYLNEQRRGRLIWKRD